MAWIKVPSIAVFLDMPHAVLHVYMILLQQHFIFCGTDYSKDFYVTDRDLANYSHCSLNTVFRAKRYLTAVDLISFSRGNKNKTFYKLKPDKDFMKGDNYE